MRGRPKTRQELACENCGKTFEKKLSDIAKTDRHFCSRNCWRVFRENLGKLLVCVLCGQEFRTNQKGQRKYCNRACFNKAKGYEKFGEEEQTCSGCGKKFTRSKHTFTKYNKFYCNKKCRLNHMQGNDNPNWQPDRSKIKNSDKG